MEKCVFTKEKGFLGLAPSFYFKFNSFLDGFPFYSENNSKIKDLISWTRKKCQIFFFLFFISVLHLLKSKWVAALREVGEKVRTLPKIWVCLVENRSGLFGDSNFYSGWRNMKNYLVLKELNNIKQWYSA